MSGAGRALAWTLVTLALTVIATAALGGCAETVRSAGAQPVQAGEGASPAPPTEGAKTAPRTPASKSPSKKKTKKRKASAARRGQSDKPGASDVGKSGEPEAPSADFEVTAEVGAVQRGVSVWYGANAHGKPTASGERFNRHKMTAAHRTLPMDTTVRVTHVKNGSSVVVRINDRGPFGKRRERIIDVSEAAARVLGIIKAGHGAITLEVLTLPASRKAKD